MSAMLINPQEIITRGQALANEAMRDTCIVRRRSTVSVTDPATGEVTTPWQTVYEGRCAAQNNRVYPSTPEAAEHGYTVGISTLKLPVAAGTRDVRAGDVAEIIDSPNPFFVGAKVTLRTDDAKTFQTSIRFNVAEVVE